MSRLYANTATAGAIATHFGTPPGDIVVPIETVEGDPGLVVRENSTGRVLSMMTWGFPRITSGLGLRGEPPERLGLLADLTNPMWSKVVTDPHYRCLIPLSHFANPDGDTGAKTRTWFSVESEPLVAWAGFCRNTPEFGPVFAGMTMEANAAIPPTNDRMPVLLDPHEYEQWLHGSIQDVIRFQYRKPFGAERMVVEPTEDRWRSGKGPPRTDLAAPQLALL